MYYPNVPDNGNTRTMIDTWLGYNHNYKPSEGEFYDMENLSSDGFPVLQPRKIRYKLLNKESEIGYRGLLYTDNVISYLDGDIFHYNQRTIDLSEWLYDTAEDREKYSKEEQNLIRFGAYIILFPANVWVKVTDIGDLTAGKVGASYEIPTSGQTIKYTMCDIDGNVFENLHVGKVEPEEKTNGMYWLCTKEGSEGLNMYYGSSWNPVATTYMMISLPDYDGDLTTMFAKEDIVYMNNKILTSVNEGSYIHAIGKNYIVVAAVPPKDKDNKPMVDYTETTSGGWRWKIERRVPSMDYVCVDKNRVWGCKYGYDDDQNLINEIYCTKLGDFKNWYSYQGLATDSFSVSVGLPGAWTGCISYGGYPTFFKENAIFRIYGSFPAEYTMIQTDARGVQKGSDKSLAIVGENLFYKAPGGVMVYNGSLPVLISSQFGRDTYYYDGVAGVIGNKYYLCLTDYLQNYKMFVYDTQYGIWMRESEFPIKFMSGAANGQMYVATSETIYGLGSTDNAIYQNAKTAETVNEEWVDWYAETGNFGYEYSDYKYVSRITIRAYIPTASELRVYICYDDGLWEELGTFRGNDEIMSQTLAITPYRCDHYKIKFSGHGDVRIYSMATTLDTGSEEYGYKN